MKIIALLVSLCLGFAPFLAEAGLGYENTLISGQDQSGSDLRGSEIKNSQVSDSNFSRSNMEGSHFRNSVLSNVILAGANLRGSSFINTSFSGSDIRGADFSGSSFENCSMGGAVADGSTNFTNVKLHNTVLPGSKKSALINNTTVVNGAVVSGTQSGGAMDIAMSAAGVNIDMNTPGMNIVVGQRGAGTASATRVQTPGMNIVVGGTSDGASSATQVTTPGMSVVVGSSAPREYKDEKAIVEVLQKPQARVDLTVNFEFDSDKILAEGHKQVYAIAQALKNPALAGKSVRIEGHTDSKGTDEYNVDLSYRRAVSVMKELSDKYQVDTAPLTVKGFGESQPVASNDSEDGRALNRRVTLVNTGSYGTKSMDEILERQ